VLRSFTGTPSSSASRGRSNAFSTTTAEAAAAGAPPGVEFGSEDGVFDDDAGDGDP
jgi:hypothetical protein